MESHAPHIISNNGLYEKSQIKWFSIDDIKNQRKEFRNYYDNEFLDPILAEEENIKLHFMNI
jgi:hypothetical protein